MSEPQFNPFIPIEDYIYDGTAYYAVPLNGEMWQEDYPRSPNMLMLHVFNWMRLNKKQGARIYYEGVDGGPFKREGNSWSANDQHRFYFTDSEQAKEFLVASSQMKNDTRYPFMELTEIRSESILLAGMLNFKVNNGFSQFTMALWLWCHDNLRGTMYLNGNSVLFTDEQDMALVRLSFMGGDKPLPTLPSLAHDDEPPIMEDTIEVLF